MSNLTIKFDMEQHRREDKDFDTWFIPLCKQNNVSIALKENEWFLQGSQASIIKLFVQMNNCLNKTFEDILKDVSKKLKT